ncbi:hypothetical protein KC19_12G181100 [Ceratodon purpureus]|uniref:Protein kinase domain-containing protein n=1 Tax=Ceratodon purpureus TaxID=3225 RepID=A0A8T0G8Q3_CERPU|nr:hypothetical protein KC19_12G181100 [Ceratodon purpureus]
MESMDLVEPIPQVSEALTVIEDVIEVSSKFLVNKHQCERLASRFGSIGEKLKELAKGFVHTTSADAGNHAVEYPAFDLLLTVLKKGKALLWKYVESGASIPSVLTRTENRKAFEEIHADLDIMNSLFHFEDFEHKVSESMKIVTLTEDADKDLKEMSDSLDELAHSESGQAAEAAAVLLKNVKNVKTVVSERSQGTGEDLPSYLTIDPAVVEISIPVREPERKSRHELNIDTYGWALVHYGSWLGCKCALKIFKSVDRVWNKSELLKEVCSLMELHHPHVVQLMGFAQDEEKCIILMELMDTDLRHFMNQRSPQGKRPFTRVQELDIITQIAKGMYYLHEQQYVHGELKCSNILVKQIGGYIDVKISDLRSSQKLGIWDPVLFRERSKRRRPRWTAPEVQKYGEVEPTHELLKKTDVYGFGMVCYEVVTGKLPFQDIFDDELKSRIEKGDLKQELPGELDPKLRGLIESCWERDPNKRPTFEAICHLLNDARSSQLAVTTKSSGKEYVQRLIRWIPKILGLIADREEKNATPASTWGPIDVEDGMEVDSDPGAANAVTLPEFVRIDPANLKKVRLIGEGAFAKVYEATWLGCKYAVKTFMSVSPIAVQREVKFLVELRHPSIVRLMGLAVHSDRQCSIVMEFMGCSLRNLIDSQKRKRKSGQLEPVDVVPFEFREAVFIITKIALGMRYLHSRDVIHRDLKADNVLVPEHSAGSNIDVKITDFGVSQLIDSSGSQKPSLGVGTTFWRAPEIFPRPSAGGSDAVGDHQSLSCDLKAADVYSFAMTCYEVVTGGVPLEDEIKELKPSELRVKVVEGLRPTLPFDLNSDLKLLIEECWSGKPEERLTFSSICQKLQKLQQGLQSSS